MSRLPPSVMLSAFVLLLLGLQLKPWKRPPASGDTASDRVLSTSDFGISPADPDLLTETRSDLPSGTDELPYLVLLSPPHCRIYLSFRLSRELSLLHHCICFLPRHKLPPSSPLQS
ncbi:hypothetical protein Bca4012_041489 [Brassica carinata]